jgi:hypothetical protein
VEIAAGNRWDALSYTLPPQKLSITKFNKFLFLVGCDAQAERKRDSAPRGLIPSPKWKLPIGHH